MEENNKLQEITQGLQNSNDLNIAATEKASLANISALAEVRSSLSSSFVEIKSAFRDLGDAIVGNDLAKAEEAKEQKTILSKIADKETEVNVNVDGGKDDGSKVAGISGMLGVAVASLAIIPGLAIGFISGLKDSFKGLAKILKLDKVFGPMIAKIKLFFTNIGQRFVKIGKAIKGIFEPIVSSIKNAFAPLTERASKLLKPLKTLFTPILDAFKKIGETFNRIKGLFGGGGDGLLKLFNPIKNFASTVAKAAPKFLSFGKAIGSLVGKLFLPFTIIMGLFDGTKGAIEGAKEQEGFFKKFIGGLGGAISGILKGLIGMPLDLLKNAIAWILGKFGMKDAESALKGFSFSDLIGNIIKIPTDFLIGIVDNIKEIFSGDGSFIGNVYRSIGELVTSLATFPLTLLQKAIIGIGELFGFDMTAFEDFDLVGKIKSLLMLPFNLMGAAFDFIKNLFSAEGREKIGAGIGKIGERIKEVSKSALKAVLPRPDPSQPWYYRPNLASKVIPKSIYKFAGIDKATGKDMPVPVEKKDAAVPQDQFTPDVPVAAVARFANKAEAEDTAASDAKELETKIQAKVAIEERLKKLQAVKEEAEKSGDKAELARIDKLVRRDENRLRMANLRVRMQADEIGKNINADANYKGQIEAIRNKQGAEMEATMSDTADAKAVVSVVQGGNTNAPVTNNTSSSVQNITYSEARHIEPSKDSYVFA